MSIEVEVSGPHPCWISLTDGAGKEIKIKHTDLLKMEHALAEARRQVLCKLPRSMWHEVDPDLARSMNRSE